MCTAPVQYILQYIPNASDTGMCAVHPVHVPVVVHSLAYTIVYNMITCCIVSAISTYIPGRNKMYKTSCGRIYSDMWCLYVARNASNQANKAF